MSSNHKNLKRTSKSAHFQDQEADNLETLNCQHLIYLNLKKLYFSSFYDLWTSLKSFLKVVVTFLHAFIDPLGRENEIGREIYLAKKCQ